LPVGQESAAPPTRALSLRHRWLQSAGCQGPRRHPRESTCDPGLPVARSSPRFPRVRLGSARVHTATQARSHVRQPERARVRRVRTWQ